MKRKDQVFELLTSLKEGEIDANTACEVLDKIFRDYPDDHLLGSEKEKRDSMPSIELDYTKDCRFVARLKHGGVAVAQLTMEFSKVTWMPLDGTSDIHLSVINHNPIPHGKELKKTVTEYEL